MIYETITKQGLNTVTVLQAFAVRQKAAGDDRWVSFLFLGFLTQVTLVLRINVFGLTRESHLYPVSLAMRGCSCDEIWHEENRGVD